MTPTNGEPWLGVFAFGYNSPLALTRVVSTPDPRRVCVISKGWAYVVSAADPAAWEEIPVSPVLDLRAVPKHNLLIFSDFTRLAAYGSRGLSWRTPPVCGDELKILHVGGETVEGTGYIPATSETARIVVDRKNGNVLQPSAKLRKLLG